MNAPSVLKRRAPAKGRLLASGTVFHIMRFSLDDGPGIRTTVFLKGCPLSCWWCHNPESQKTEPELLYYAERCRLCGDCVGACPEHALSLTEDGLRPPAGCRLCGMCVDACLAEARQIVGKRMTCDQVLGEIERDVVFFDESGGGVTFSGGEPLAQPVFLDSLLTACRERRIHTVLDTCGLVQRQVLLRLAAKAGLVLYDLKSVDPQKHRACTGVSNHLILRNLQALVEAGLPVLVRLPIIPGVNDSAAEVSGAVALLARLRIREVDLLPYHRTGTEKYRRLGLTYHLEGLEPPSAGRMAQIAGEFENAGIKVRQGKWQ